MKYLFTMITMLCLAGGLVAQNNGLIRGKLLDSAGKQSLALATITIFTAKDTSIVTYRLSDPQGEFKVPGLPLNIACRAVISFSGYRVYRKEFELTATQSQLDFGTIKLQFDPTALDEVLVIAERPPVSVKKDTIEFNASAFKTLPTALVEDLLKKLPGVDLDKDGNITVNGRSVNRILVDGKDFFGGDPKVATRNLPANVIDKVQVTDDKDQLAQDPFIDKSSLGQVINLRLKRSIKKGWFGKMYAGAGTDDRYEAGGIINLFRDTLQISLLGFSNNVNRQAFNMNEIERLGGFGRTGINEVNNDNGAFSVNGIPFGGGNQGITKSAAGGINVNQDFGKKLTLNLQYFYGESDNQQRQLSNNRQTFNDTVLTTRNVTNRRSNEYSHRIGSNLRWRPDSFTNVRFEPRLVLKKARSMRELVSTTRSNYEDLLNESENEQRDQREETSYRHELTYQRTFKKKDRAMMIGNGINVTFDKPRQFNEATNTFYDGQTGSSILSQLRNRKVNNEQYSFGIAFIEPVGKQTRMRFWHAMHVIRNEDLLQTFNKPVGSDKYEEPNPDLSNEVKRSGTRHSSKVSFRWFNKKLTLTATAGTEALNFDNRFLKAPDIKQNYLYFTPQFTVAYKDFNLDYRLNVNEPNIMDLQPVADNTNPLYVVQGNPTLVPTRSHVVQAWFRKYNTPKLISYNGSFRVTYDLDGIVRARTVDVKGVQTTRPENVDGNQRVYLSYNVTKQYKYKSGWQLSLRSFMSGEYAKSMVIVNNTRNFQKNWRLSPNVAFAFNWKDKVEFTQQYGIGWNKAINPNTAFIDAEVVTHTSSSEIVIRLPKRLVWESNIDYSYNPQISPGFRKSFTRWNAAVNILFLKDDQAQLKLAVFDLLNQNINVNRATRDNFIQDNQTEVLQRYFMLTFTYNIRNVGGKVGGKQLFRF